MTISLRALLIAALAVAVGAAGWLTFLRAEAAPATAVRAADAPRPAGHRPEGPIATVEGETPGMRLTLLAARRTGPKVVSVRLRIDNESEDLWMPYMIDGGLSAADMRLVDEVNGREHFVLRDADDACLCSGDFVELPGGASSVISAKFPAPPADVRQVSVETPGFASFDGVPLS
jgi:hypothetical protein